MATDTSQPARIALAKNWAAAAVWVAVMLSMPVSVW